MLKKISLLMAVMAMFVGAYTPVKAAGQCKVSALSRTSPLGVDILNSLVLVPYPVAPTTLPTTVTRVNVSGTTASFATNWNQWTTGMGNEQQFTNVSKSISYTNIPCTTVIPESHSVAEKFTIGFDPASKTLQVSRRATPWIFRDPVRGGHSLTVNWATPAAATLVRLPNWSFPKPNFTYSYGNDFFNEWVSLPPVFYLRGTFYELAQADYTTSIIQWPGTNITYTKFVLK